jgi:hypothetical protein
MVVAGMNLGMDKKGSPVADPAAVCWRRRLGPLSSFSLRGRSRLACGRVKSLKTSEESS